MLKQREEIENIKKEEERKKTIEENIKRLKELGYITDIDTIDLWSNIKRLMKVKKDYTVAMELAHLVKDKNGKYLLIMGIFEDQYLKLKEHRDKINYYLNKFTKGKNDLEVIFEVMVNF